VRLGLVVNQQGAVWYGVVWSGRSMMMTMMVIVMIMAEKQKRKKKQKRK
jgi:cytochrome oxidase assembly protein ShyY1